MLDHGGIVIGEDFIGLKSVGVSDKSPLGDAVGGGVLV